MVDSMQDKRWFNYPARFPGRPFPLKLLAAGLAVFSILCWMRFSQALAEAKLIAQITAAPLGLYWSISGAVWGMLGMLALIFLWLRQTWSLWLIGIGTCLFTAWFWLDRAFFQSNPDRWSSWLFTLILNVLILIFIYSTIIYLHPDRRAPDAKDVSHEQ